MAKNSSTVIPAWRMRARSVPTESSLCCGTERLTRTPGFTITRWLPTWPIARHPAFSKVLAASLPEMLPSRATRLNRDQDFELTDLARLGRHRLLVFSPEPRGNRFLDVAERFLLILALGNASRQGRAFNNDPTVFCLRESYVKDHAPLYYHR
jgi:hypothetical protein